MTETSSEGDSNSARAQLEEARDILARQLEEACRVTAQGNAPETTGELRRLDDALLAAARTTEEMIALRGEARRERNAIALADIGGGVSTGVERIREFSDASGTRWRVWAVVPGQATTSSPRNLGELQNGWLAFESLDTGAKRRLAQYPPGWVTLRDEELERLLESAAAAPQRKRGGEASAPE